MADEDTTRGVPRSQSGMWSKSEVADCMMMKDTDRISSWSSEK